MNLSIKENRDELAETIQNDIEEYCQKIYHSGHRKHLGASIIGNLCSRQLFYNFRWVKEEIIEGRIGRLFNVGHEAEPRFINYLRGIGFEVQELDPATGKQFRISAAGGHYGGSLDGRCKAPARYNLPEDLIFLNEFKTNNTGAGYVSVGKDGIFKAKPKHYAQMCQYGKHYKLKYGLYLIENKNDSDITIQIVELDWNYGQQLENKAIDIITAKFPPPKISDNPDYFECKYCFALDICHHGEAVEINCRSCKFSTPVDNGEWYCNKHNGTIPENFIPTGCPDHSSINEF